MKKKHIFFYFIILIFLLSYLFYLNREWIWEKLAEGDEWSDRIEDINETLLYQF
jgi:hypothetical protein